MSGTLRLRGATSGYSELQAPAVAADQTFVLPTAGGTLLTTDSPIPKLTLELGSASQPSLTFEGDTDTGLYSSGTNTLNLVTGGNNRLNINSSGNVGIGTTSPSTKLDVNGNVQFGDGGGFDMNINGTRHQFSIGGSEKMRIDSSGNLGVGTTSPGTGISGSAQGLSVAHSNVAFLSVENTAASGKKYTLYGNDAGSLVTYDEDASAERMRIDSSGRVGLNTSSPSYLLDVNGVFRVTGESQFDADIYRGGDPQLGAEGTALFGGTVVIRNTFGSNSVFRGQVVGSTDYKIDLKASGDASFLGNIGIGTTTPEDSLHIKSNSGAIRLENTVVSNNDSTITYNDTDLAFHVDPNNVRGSSSITFSGDGSERARIDSSGNLGIGTASPAQLLDIASTAPNIRLTDTVDGHSEIDGNAANLKFNADKGNVKADSNISFAVDNTERMRIDSSGRLLVGATSGRANFYHSIVSPQVQQEGAGDFDRQAAIISSSSTGHFGAAFILAHQKSGSLGGNTALANGDVSGLLSFQANDGSHFLEHARIQASVDGASGADDMPGALQFFTAADGAQTVTERMRITSSSDSHVLIGKTVANTSSGTGVQLIGGSASSVDIVINASSNIGVNHVYNINPTNSGYRFYIAANGGIYNHSNNNSNLCDEREKKDIVVLDDKWDIVKSWKIKKFHYISDADSDSLSIGVIAQEVETQCPEVISDWVKEKAEDAVLDDEGNVVTPAKEEILRKGVKEQQMMWMGIKALQEAMAKIETLEAKVAALEAG